MRIYIYIYICFSYAGDAFAWCAANSEAHGGSVYAKHNPSQTLKNIFFELQKRIQVYYIYIYIHIHIYMRIYIYIYRYVSRFVSRYV